MVHFVLEIFFMILGSMVVAWFSRLREFRADQGGARLAGRQSMINALERLRQTTELVDPNAQPAVQTLKISGRGSGLMRFFASHPPLEERIARLQK
jgi:heat shock protein HtpX